MLRYVIRSILAQRVSSAVAVGVLTCLTAIIGVLFGLIQGLEACARAGADPLVTVVLQERQTTEGSDISHEWLVRLLGVLPAGMPSSIETHARLPIGDGTGKFRELIIRGVEPAALQVHAQARVRGRLPASGEPACAIGARQLGRYPDVREGGEVALGRYRWPLVGVVESKDAPFESELWCDRAFLKRILKRDTDSVVYLRLDGVEQQAKMTELVKSLKGSGLRALSEPAYQRERLKDLAVYFDAIYVIFAILAASMVITGANTIYTSFLGRIGEIAVLMAIGYSRRRVMLLMTLESLLLTGTGAAVGLGIALLFDDHRLAIEEVGMVFAVKVDARVLWSGAIMTLATGLLSSVIANVQIARISILGSIRE